MFKAFIWWFVLTFRREYRDAHGAQLRTLYNLLKRKREDGDDYPSMLAGEDDYEPGTKEGWEEFAEEYRLEAGPSRIAKLVLPPIPRPPAPETTIDYPDEPPVAAPTLPIPDGETQPLEKVEVEVEVEGEVTAAPAVDAEADADDDNDDADADADGESEAAVLKSSSKLTSAVSTPPPTSPRTSRSSRPASPARDPRPPRATVSLQDILPRREQDALVPEDLDVPPWEPFDNYNPAQVPPESQALKVLMPLETDYIAAIPPLPSMPATAHRHRRGSKGDSGKVDSFKLSLTYSLNPLAGGISKSSKCVLTSDWRVAQAELRHIRAMERIEAKKASGRWSLRQPKKHRGPPVPKSQWDWLLEEMVSDLLTWLTLRNGCK